MSGTTDAPAARTHTAAADDDLVDRWRAATGLTADEAAARGQQIGSSRYRVHIDLSEFDRGEFVSSTTVIFDVHAPGRPVWIDLIAEEVLSVNLNGRAMPLGDVVGRERLVVPQTLARNTVTVVARHRAGSASAGLCRSVDSADGSTYAWTQFQPFDARRMFPCFDQPDLRGVVSLTVTAPEPWTCVSNSRPSGQPVPAAAGMAVHAFTDTPVIPVCVVALCAGPFSQVHGQLGDIPASLYARRSLASALGSAAPELFSLTQHGLEWFSGHFGRPFPGDKYDHVFLPDQPGAMENLGCVTWNDSVLFRSAPTIAQRARRALVLLHELSHQWFGNLVSPRWWDDLWLSESFADWAAVWALRSVPELAEHAGDGPAVYKPIAVRSDQLPGSHPVSRAVADMSAVEANFDAITYHKGACLLHQLVDMVGEESFLAGLRSYFRRFAWSAATVDGLLDELGATTSVDVRRWAAEWLRTSGVNTLRVHVEASLGRYRIVRLRQSASASRPLLRTHRLPLTEFRLVDGDLRAEHTARLAASGPLTEVRGLAGRPVADLLLPDSDDRGYLKVRLDPDSFEVLLAHGQTLAGPRVRAVARQIIDDMLFDSEVDARSAVRVLTAFLATEVGDRAFASTVDLCAGAALRYSAPRHRRELSAQVADICLAIADGPGTPPAQRNAAWLGVARTAATPDQLAALVRALGTVELPQAVRWEMITRLVAEHGPEAGDDLVRVEQQQDSDPDGWISAASARAAADDRAAKQSGLTLILTGTRLPSGRIAQVSSGLWQPFQPATTNQAAADYFAGLPQAVAEGGTARGIRQVTGGFPTAGVDDDLVRAARSLAADPDLPAAVRTVLADQADVAARMLRTGRRPS